MQPEERQPVVSVITPTYNHAAKLKGCIQSVLAQTFKNWEMIIVNNYSEDNTIEVVESFQDPRLKLINFHNHGVIAASRNKAIRSARGNLIAFLDSDDRWYPKKLAHAFRAMQTADLCFHDLNLDYGESLGRLKRRKLRGRQLRRPVFRDLLLYKTPLYNSSITVHRSFIEQVGYISEERGLIGAEDTDLWLKIARKTENFQYIPATLGTYWDGGGNMTEASHRQIDRITCLFEKHIRFLNADNKLRALLLLRYSIGRIYQQMGLPCQALSQFKLSIRSPDKRIRLKSIMASIRAWFDIFIRSIVKV